MDINFELNHQTLKQLKLMIYILAFIEGFLVMAFELLAARFIAPYFGNSIYVWTAVLGLTMISLLIGYFLGGRIVHIGKHNKFPLPTLILSSIILLMLPTITNLLKVISNNFDLVFGSLAAAFTLLFFPLVLLGSVSAQFIQQISEKDTLAGVSSGNIYSVSTMGGVIGTFLIGLYMIPHVGMRGTCLYLGLSTGLLFLTIYFLQHKLILKSFLFLLGIIGSLFLIQSYKTPTSISSDLGDTLYFSDSMMGKLEVVKTKRNTFLLNNGAIQSKYSLKEGASSLLYTHAIAGAASFLPVQNRNKALLIGLAAGTLINELLNLDFKKIEAVDIDPRTKYISENYFDVDKNSFDFIEDDGRHYLRKSNELYDLIIIDVSAGDSQPFHLYTLEAFKEYKNKLSEDGMIIINILDLIQRSKFTTTEKIGDGLLKAGFKPYLLKNLYGKQYSAFCIKNEIPHEKIIVATQSNLFDRVNNVDERKLNKCCSKIQYVRSLSSNWHRMSELKINFSNTPFTDNLSKMELMSYKKSKKLKSNLN